MAAASRLSVRACTADGASEVALVTYQHFADRDPLTRLVLEQMLAGVSTRRFVRTREPVGTEVGEIVMSSNPGIGSSWTDRSPP